MYGDGEDVSQHHLHRRTPAEWALALAACELACVNVGLGLTLLMGRPSRTSAASFDIIRQLAPVHWWGTAFIVTGVLALLCQLAQRWRVVAVAHASAGMMCLFWVVAFLFGLHNPNVSATGIWAYAGLASVHFTVGATARYP